MADCPAANFAGMQSNNIGAGAMVVGPPLVRSDEPQSVGAEPRGTTAGNDESSFVGLPIGVGGGIARGASVSGDMVAVVVLGAIEGAGFAMVATAVVVELVGAAVSGVAVATDFGTVEPDPAATSLASFAQAPATTMTRTATAAQSHDPRAQIIVSVCATRARWPIASSRRRMALGRSSKPLAQV